jgi:hypothetical protein
MPNSIAGVVILFKLQAYQKLNNDFGIIFEDWLKDSADSLRLQYRGYTKYQVQNILYQGFINCWLKDSIEIKNGRLKNQTIDHYQTVLQLAGVLIENEFQNVTVKLWDDVDVSGIFNYQSYAWEYERPKSNSCARISNKIVRHKNEYDHLIFLTSVANEKRVREFSGNCPVLRRGSQLRRYLEQLKVGCWYL